MSHDGQAGAKTVVREGTLASIHRMVQFNVSCGTLSASNREALSELHRRLMRVRGFGGAYEEIGFSPDVKALMRGAGMGEQVRT